MPDVTPYLVVNDYLRDNLFDPVGIDPSILLQAIAKKTTKDALGVVVESDAGVFTIITDIDAIPVNSNAVRANIDGYQRRALDGMTKTNQLKSKIPNFVFVYGFMSMGQPIIHKQDIILSIGLRSTPYIFQEHVSGAMRLRDFMDISSSTDRFLVAFQLLLAMNYAQSSIDYTHGGLSRCIFVCDLGSVQSIEYPYLDSNLVTIQSRYIPYIHGSVEKSNDSDLRDIIDLLRHDPWYRYMNEYTDYSSLIQYLITDFIRDVQIKSKPEAILVETPTQPPEKPDNIDAPGLELFIQFYGHGIKTQESRNDIKKLLYILDRYIQVTSPFLDEQAADTLEGIEGVVTLTRKNTFITTDWMHTWSFTVGSLVFGYKNYLLAQVIRNYLVETFSVDRSRAVIRKPELESVVTAYNTETSNIRRNLRKGLLTRSNVQLIDLVLFPTRFHILDYSGFSRFADLPIDIQVSIADLLDYSDLSRLCSLGLCSDPRLQSLLQRKDIDRHVADLERVLDAGDIVFATNPDTELTLSQDNIYSVPDFSVLDSIPGVVDRNSYAAKIQNLPSVIRWLYDNGYKIKIQIGDTRYTYPEDADLLDLLL